MAVLTIPKSDKGFYINFTVQDSAGVAYDLTGYTIKLKVWSPGISGTLLLTGTCNIVNATAGTCRYLIAATDFTIIGTYLAELELTKTNVVESTEPFRITVVESG